MEPQADAPGVLRAGAEPPSPDQEADRRPSAATSRGARVSEQGVVDRLHARHAVRGASLPDAERAGVREALAIEVDTSLPAARVVRVLDQVKSWRGTPEAIRCDNGPELLSETFRAWCEENDIEIRYIQPGKPNQNAFIERFNRTFRSEVLSAYLFEDLDQVRQIAWEWMIEYNEERPHDALGKIPPSAFREKVEAENSSYELSA